MIETGSKQTNNRTLRETQIVDRCFRSFLARKFAGLCASACCAILIFAGMAPVQAKLIDPPPYPDDPPAPTPDPLPIRKGMTWTVLNQQGPNVQVGSDMQTNAYTGDTPIDAYLPVLCVLVDGRAAPGGINFGFNNGWVKGMVQTTPAYPGVKLTSRQQGDVICDATFGPGWRLAEFHDASGGWTYWAARGERMALAPGSRFWVAINDQLANPWNSYGQTPVLTFDTNKPMEATCSLPTTYSGIDPIKAAAEACPGEPDYIKGMEAPILVPPADEMDNGDAGIKRGTAKVDEKNLSAGFSINGSNIANLGKLATGWNTVGVIMEADGCGIYPRYDVFFDNEDSFNANKRGGWIGGILSNRNTQMPFCAINSDTFLPAIQAGAKFALLNIGGGVCPPGTVKFDRFHNNETNRPMSWDSMPPGSYTKTVLPLDPNVHQKNTNMSFCVAKGFTPNAVTNGHFPNLGISYGVFGGHEGNPAWALSSGWIHMDDQDGGNWNQPEVPPAYTVDFLTAGRNTDYYLLKIKSTTPPPPPVNLALGAIASASSTFCSGDALNCYSPDRIRDGNPSTLLGGKTSWANLVYPNPPQWVQLAWNAPIVFSRIELFTTENYPIRDFVIQYRTQANTWANIPGPFFPANNTDLHLTYVFPPVMSGAIRVLCNSGPLHQQGYCRVNELEVYK